MKIEKANETGKKIVYFGPKVRKGWSKWMVPPTFLQRRYKYGFLHNVSPRSHCWGYITEETHPASISWSLSSIPLHFQLAMASSRRYCKLSLLVISLAVAAAATTSLKADAQLLGSISSLLSLLRIDGILFCSATGSATGSATPVFPSKTSYNTCYKKS